MLIMFVICLIRWLFQTWMDKRLVAGARITYAQSSRTFQLREMIVYCMWIALKSSCPNCRFFFIFCARRRNEFPCTNEFMTVAVVCGVIVIQPVVRAHLCWYEIIVRFSRYWQLWRPKMCHTLIWQIDVEKSTVIPSWKRSKFWHSKYLLSTVYLSTQNDFHPTSSFDTKNNIPTSF